MAKAFSRKWLEALGLDAEKIDVLVEAHGDIVAEIIKQRDEYKAQLDGMSETMVDKSELAKVRKELDDMKTAQQKKTEHEAKEAALKAVYKEAGIAEKYIPALLRIADYDAVEVGADGKAKTHKELVEAAKKDCAEFIPVVTEVAGQKTATPPTSGSTMTKAEILAIKDTTARQKAIAENLNLFGG